ncbi:MAG TPA: sarcosine oxidase subunit gamma [Rhodobacteraceae bacterium]|jgi:sarcosine oxidase subunit gamma|nr:sarcosine oxidase subunit gamma [Paracoccaceae bacterium]
MSKAVSALAGVRAGGLVEIEETGLRGMITLRGDLSSGPLKKAVKAAVGVEMPAARGVTFAGANGVAWMSPDEVLVMVPYDAADATVAALSTALAGQHHLAVNVSDARAVFRLSGEDTLVREVIAKVAPVDMELFGPGQIRRTRVAQVAGAFWQPEAGVLELVCFRSVAQYVFDLLKVSASEGSAVGHIG